MVLRRQLDEAMTDLEHMEAEMLVRGLDPTSLGEYLIHFV